MATLVAVLHVLPRPCGSAGCPLGPSGPVRGGAARPHRRDRGQPLGGGGDHHSTIRAAHGELAALDHLRSCYCDRTCPSASPAGVGAIASTDECTSVG